MPVKFARVSAKHKAVVRTRWFWGIAAAGVLIWIVASNDNNRSGTTSYRPPWSGIDGTLVDALDQAAAHLECKSTVEAPVVAAPEAASERDSKDYFCAPHEWVP